jgi:hypothetical protein
MVEVTTFGSDFVPLRICKELTVAMKYKPRMFGVPIDGPANVFCDNHGVVKSVSIPELTLIKKHNAIYNHAVREAASSSGYHANWKGRWRNKFGGSIDESDCWAKEMGLLFIAILLKNDNNTWFDSQGIFDGLVS